MTELPATISFHTGSWLENAGIVGINRILGNENCKVSKNQLTVSTNSLTNFSTKYFNYFTNTRCYGKLTRFQRILAFENQLNKWQQDNFESFTDGDLEHLSKWYRDILKYSIKSNSFKRVYQLINSELDVVEILKSTDKLIKTLEKKNFLSKNPIDAKNILHELVPQLIKIIEYFKQEESKKYFPAKTLSYSIINNAWNGVSFLNPQTKIADFYEDYQKYFVDPVVDYLSIDHSKDKFICSTCGRPIKSQKLSYSFINGMGYDISKKTSNAWNFHNNQFICPICQLMYSCVSAGFNYSMSKQGIFINNNHSLDELIDSNRLILESMIREMIAHGNVSPFRAFSTSFEEQLNSSVRYSVANIQVVTYDHDNYSFTVIPPLAVRVMERATKTEFGKKTNGKNLLSILYPIGIRQFRGSSYYSIYDEVIRRLFNSTNLYSLIYQLELLLNSQSPDVRYNTVHLMALININTIFFQELLDGEEREGVPIMKVNRNELSRMRGAGVHVLNNYQREHAPEKANALGYKLLQALNSGNAEKFMAILLRVYAGQHQLVPSNLVNNIDQPEVFKQYALAFIAGLIGSKDEKGVQNHE